MNTFTVTPILAALVLGLVLQATNIYDFHKRQVGTLEIEPWRAKTTALSAATVRASNWFRSFFSRHRLRIAGLGMACLALALSATHPHAAAAPVFLAGIVGSEPTLADVNRAIDEGNRGLVEFRAKYEGRQDGIEKMNLELQSRLNKLEITGGGARPAPGALGLPVFPSLREYEALRAKGPSETRVMSSDSDPAGGYLVPEGEAKWWDRLRALLAVMRANPIFIGPDAFTSDSIRLPYLSSSTTVVVAGQGDTITASDAAVGMGTMFARKFGAYSVATSELISDSNPGARTIIGEDHALQIAAKLDLQMLEGSGVGGNFNGLRNAAGVKTSLGTNGLKIVLNDIEAMLLRLESSNCDMSRVAMFMHPRTWSTLRLQVDGQSRYQLQPDPTSPARSQLFGVPVFRSSQMSITETQGSSSDCSYVAACDMSRVVVGQRSPVSVLIDPYSYSSTDKVALRSLTRAGFFLVHAAACEVVYGVRAV